MAYGTGLAATGSDEHPIEPIDTTRLDAALDGAGLTWPRPELLPVTGSTNDDVEMRARAGAPEGTCVVADEQTAGRGRLGRTWASPPGAGLWMSVLVRVGPGDPITWLPLAAGLALTDALASACGVRAELKWPNDVVVIAAACGGSDGPRKLGGVLSALVPDAPGQGSAIVLGMGINVSLISSDLPTPQATSVLLEGGRVDRTALLSDVLVSLERRLAQWRADGHGLAEDYRAQCATIGRRVTVELPGRPAVAGVVTGLDADGHLLVSDGESLVTVTAGDVIHATI